MHGLGLTRVTPMHMPTTYHTRSDIKINQGGTHCTAAANVCCLCQHIVLTLDKLRIETHIKDSDEPGQIID